MIKKILIGFGVVIILLVIVFIGLTEIFFNAPR